MTEQDFLAWLDNSVTRTFRAYLLLRKEEIKDLWASGAFAPSGMPSTEDVAARAQCRLIDTLLGIEASDLQEIGNAS
jgi:hypothetical protein